MVFKRTAVKLGGAIFRRRASDGDEKNAGLAPGGGE